MAFSPEDLQFTLNGHVFEGWSDDSDFFMLTQNNAHTVTRIGGDGRRMRVSNPSRKGTVATCKLMPDSPSVRFMQQQVEASRTGAPTIFEGSAVNQGEYGGSVSLSDGVLVEAPDWWTFGSGDVANMVYTFDFGEVAGQWDGVNLS